MRKRFLPLFLLGALLAACGGSHNADGPSAPPPPPPGGGTTAADVFTLQVASLVVSASDDTEPATLDASAAALPEDAEPQALQ